MKSDIHPEYVECKVTCGCGNSFTTRATVGELAVEVCSACHPFYTGQQRFVDTAGRVEKFQKKFKWNAAQAVQEADEAAKKAREKAAKKKAAEAPKKAPAKAKSAEGKKPEKAAGEAKKADEAKAESKKPDEAKAGAGGKSTAPGVGEESKRKRNPPSKAKKESLTPKTGSAPAPEAPGQPAAAADEEKGSQGASEG